MTLSLLVEVGAVIWAVVAHARPGTFWTGVWTTDHILAASNVVLALAALLSIRASGRVARSAEREVAQNADLVEAVKLQADVATQALEAAKIQADVASQALASEEKPVIVPALDSGTKAAEWGQRDESTTGKSIPWFRLRLRNVGQGPALFPAKIHISITLFRGRMLMADTHSNVFAPGDEFTAFFEDSVPVIDDAGNLARVFELAANEPYKHIARLPVTVAYTDMTGRWFKTEIECTCYPAGQVEFGRIRFG